MVKEKDLKLFAEYVFKYINNPVTNFGEFACIHKERAGILNLNQR
jgi:hypothetical protein